MFKKQATHQKRLEYPWSHLFSELNDYDISLTKKMVYHSFLFSESFEEKGIISSITMGQRGQIIAFAKMIHYHLISSSPIHHELFWGFLHELYIKHYKEDPAFVISLLLPMKTIDKWYVDDYINSNNTDRISRMIDRFYNSLKRFENESLDTHLVISRNAFSNVVGPMIEALHQEYLPSFPSTEQWLL